MKVEYARFHGGLATSGLNSGVITVAAAARSRWTNTRGDSRRARRGASSQRSSAGSAPGARSTTREFDALALRSVRVSTPIQRAVRALLREPRRFGVVAAALVAARFRRCRPPRSRKRRSRRSIPRAPRSRSKPAARRRASGGATTSRRATLYDAALLAGFDRFMLPDGARLRYLNLVPNPAERPQSSLGYMMAHVSAAARRRRAPAGTCAATDLLFEAFLARRARRPSPTLRRSASRRRRSRSSHALDEMSERVHLVRASRGIAHHGNRRLQRTRAHRRARRTLRAARARAFGLAAERDRRRIRHDRVDVAVLRRRFAGDGRGVDARRKVAPPWLRTRVVGPDGATLPNGTVGALAARRSGEPLVMRRDSHRRPGRRASTTDWC